MVVGSKRLASPVKVLERLEGPFRGRVSPAESASVSDSDMLQASSAPEVQLPGNVVERAWAHSSSLGQWVSHLCLHLVPKSRLENRY